MVNKQLVDVTVWVDAWQTQCCGEPFSVGATVRWTALPADPRDYSSVTDAPGGPSHIDLHEEHHGDYPDLRPVQGLALSIRAVYQRYEPLADDPRSLVPVDSSAEFVTLTRATGWEGERPGVELAGYLVEVDPNSQS